MIAAIWLPLRIVGITADKSTLVAGQLMCALALCAE